MKPKTEHFIGVTSEKKQVKVIKILEPMEGYPGKYKLPIFQLSTGQQLNPIDKENIRFSIIGTNILVGIISD